MTWLALAFALQHADATAPPAPASGWTATGRIVDLPALHLGARPAVFIDPEGDDGQLEWGAGLTVQLTAAVL